jgi:large subunit ribosomal protein L18e
MISKTQINKRTSKKRSMELVETIRLARDNNQLELAKKLSGPTRKQARVNLSELNKVSEKNIMIVGKVLGEGELDKKMTISALGFSESAKEKLKKAGCETKTIKKEIETNPKLTGVKILQ